MAAPKGFSDRVESWLARIPGIRTYRDREHRRETDKRLREHLASRLQDVRSQLSRTVLDLSQKGEFAHLEDMDRLSSRIQQVADTIRYASYGYAGIFDVEKIREEELDQLYAVDLSLMDDLGAIKSKVAELSQGSLEKWKTTIEEAFHLLDCLEEKFRQRNEFMAQPLKKSGINQTRRNA
ncbi:MAG: hypothetical protein HY882_07965 [Deltaproteobacteria bacterium]|nr:hypothetical protein [Deltaproteobacteria bacterium]